MLLSSVKAGWSRDVVVERLSLPPTERPEHGILDHRLIVNVGRPVSFGWIEDGRHRHGVLETGMAHVQPHGAVNRPRWSEQLDIASLAFAPALFERLLDGHSAEQSDPVVERRNQPDPFAHRTVQHLITELKTPTERLYAEMLCLALALHLLRSDGRATRAALRPRPRLSPVQARRVLEKMRAELGGQLPIAMLAAEAGLSDAHFARAFRASFGEPPHRLMLRWRLERAEYLIAREGNAPADAALAAGFCDQAHLTNAMRRQRGTTPGILAKARTADRGMPAVIHRGQSLPIEPQGDAGCEGDPGEAVAKGEAR